MTFAKVLKIEIAACTTAIISFFLAGLSQDPIISLSFSIAGLFLFTVGTIVEVLWIVCDRENNDYSEQEKKQDV